MFSPSADLGASRSVRLFPPETAAANTGRNRPVLPGESLIWCSRTVGLQDRRGNQVPRAQFRHHGLDRHPVFPAGVIGPQHGVERFVPV